MQEKERKFRELNVHTEDVKCNVIRDGRQQLVLIKNIVVGDTIVLSTGDILCADGLVYERNNLSIFEGPLTGESHPIAKGTDGDGRAKGWRSEVSL